MPRYLTLAMAALAAGVLVIIALVVSEAQNCTPDSPPGITLGHTFKASGC